jgi:hypothetical protein
MLKLKITKNLFLRHHYFNNIENQNYYCRCKQI